MVSSALAGPPGLYDILTRTADFLGPACGAYKVRPVC